VCPAKTASCHGAFVTADRFMVNVLAADQADVAAAFARSGPDKFSGSPMEPCEYGLPGLPGATARIACSRYEVRDGGDHSILIGRVEAVSTGGTEPLVYHNRLFTRPGASPSLVSSA
jgi:flavin reductase (DIM6/NTAB) family NADH-FMN oxidoreductase RutF